jgi:2-keto-4-pentenoate hydratase/2-oxohepta-3-ene-1,7-dioic acid hydratase in catechol pathway
MRFVGYGNFGQRWVGALKDGAIAPLATAADFYSDLKHWMAVAETAEAGLAPGELQLAPAVWEGARVLCVGLNYRKHAAEGGFDKPPYPAMFGRWTRSLVTDGDGVPALEERLDWEAELAVVVGDKLAAVDEEAALAGVFGYACFNDISARTYQRHAAQWTAGKNMDRSGVMGPVVTKDEVGDPASGLNIQCRLNGQVMQNACTSDMIFPVGRILSYLSEICTLYPGDVIVTGTPQGVGHARNPPLFMKPGDVVEVEIEKIGVVRNPIVDGSRRDG